MRIGTGFVLALLVGALWGVIAVVTSGIAITLMTGLAATPVVLAGAIAGAASAGVIVTRDPDLRTQAVSLGAFLAAVVGLLATSFAAPFSQTLGVAPVIQAVAIALVCGAVTLGNLACLSGIEAGNLNRYRIEVLLARVFKGVGFVFFTVMVVLPFYVMVMTSLKNQQQLIFNPLDLSVDLSKGLGLFESYYQLFTQYNFGRFMLISAIVSVSAVIITLLFSIPGAYAVARLRFPGRSVMTQSILLIYMVPAIVLVIPLYAVFSQLGLRDTILGLLIVYPATTVPVALYMLQGYFRGLPPELEEAGLMDGLNRFGVIRKITLPLSLPALASVALYVFMIAWNEFLFAFMFLDDPSIFTLPRGVVALDSAEVPRQHLMAGAVVATVPILVIFLWFEKFLVQGLTAGSVKG
ncbi:carbohydrate ABC transporter permease [Pelagibacterium halotolerans]|uniref:carbohydrate ABC transporter permease n=1 Tax=Pelagibacterium halotolerans TaxID=531813 RepID=UPI0038506B3F